MRPIRRVNFSSISLTLVQRHAVRSVPGRYEVVDFNATRESRAESTTGFQAPTLVPEDRSLPPVRRLGSGLHLRERRKREPA